MKTIIVTGGNRGIGYEVSRQLGELGHRIIIASRSKEKGTEAAKSLKEKGYDASFMMLDLEQFDSIRSFIQLFDQAYDSLDVLINNAAILEDNSYRLKDLPQDVLLRMMATNLHAPILLTQALLPKLKQSKDPRVINLSSGMGALSAMSGGNPAYRISKAAINAFTGVLAAEEPKIKVNSVCPGWVKTDMGGLGATRTVERGAETPVWLATTEEIPSGKFLRDKKIIDW